MLFRSDDEQTSDAPRPKRAGTKKVVVLESSDEESDAGKKKTKAKPKPKKRISKKTDASSDYEDSGSEASEEDPSDAAESDDEDVKPKKKTASKGKGKAAAKPKKVTKKSRSSDDDDAMDVDDDEPSTSAKGKKKPANSKKRKSAEPSSDDDTKAPAGKKQRSAQDPWGLKSVAVRKDWTQMRCPPLDMFHFARIVVDEYTYIDKVPKLLFAVTKLTAERHWVLSGTPPIHDFGALKIISTFMGVHLGVYDEAEGSSSQVNKKAKREQTGKYLCIFPAPSSDE